VYPEENAEGLLVGFEPKLERLSGARLLAFGAQRNADRGFKGLEGGVEGEGVREEEEEERRWGLLAFPGVKTLLLHDSSVAVAVVEELLSNR
jgi:hypothetical protein